jgi:hypothetical protein
MIRFDQIEPAILTQLGSNEFKIKSDSNSVRSNRIIKKVKKFYFDLVRIKFENLKTL